MPRNAKANLKGALLGATLCGLDTLGAKAEPVKGEVPSPAGPLSIKPRKLPTTRSKQKSSNPTKLLVKIINVPQK